MIVLMLTMVSERDRRRLRVEALEADVKQTKGTADWEGVAI